MQLILFPDSKIFNNPSLKKKSGPCFLTAAAVTTAPPADLLRYRRSVKTFRPSPPQRRCAAAAASVWAWRRLSRTSPSVGNVMDVASRSEAARRIPQMAEWARMRLPSSIFVSVSLFTAETTAALYLSSTYRSAGDQIWQALTLLFTLIPSVLVQLTLTFIHRDLSRDRPLVLLLHLLQLGPIVRSVGRCLSARCSVICQDLLQVWWFVCFANMLAVPAHKLFAEWWMRRAHAAVVVYRFQPFTLAEWVCVGGS